MSQYPKEMVSFRYHFTKEEQELNSQLMANAAVAINELEDEKKAVASEFKAKIDAKTAELNLLSRHVIDRYTQRSEYLGKRKNFDTMQWEWFDEDGTVRKTEPLTGKDRQRDINFDEPEETPEQPADKPFDQETGEIFGSEQPEAPSLPPLESILEKDKPKLALNGIVTPEVEDMGNGEEPQPETTLEPLEAKVLGLPEPETPQESEEVTDKTRIEYDEQPEDRNEGADFDASTYNPESEESLNKYPAKKTKATKTPKTAKASTKPAKKDKK